MYSAISWIPFFIPRLDGSLFFTLHLLCVFLLFAVLIVSGIVTLATTVICIICKRPVPMLCKVIAAGIAGFAAFLVIHIGVIMHVPKPLPEEAFQMSFSSEVWLSESSSYPEEGQKISARQKMLGSVIKDILPGKSRQEIEICLGPSFETAHFGGSKYDLIYPLGWDRGIFPIDHEWLLIWLDEQGIFERYEITAD